MQNTPKQHKGVIGDGAVEAVDIEGEHGLWLGRLL
jgi:hypothetical protein